MWRRLDSTCWGWEWRSLWSWVTVWWGLGLLLQQSSLQVSTGPTGGWLGGRGWTAAASCLLLGRQCEGWGWGEQGSPCSSLESQLLCGIAGPRMPGCLILWLKSGLGLFFCRIPWFVHIDNEFKSWHYEGQIKCLSGSDLTCVPGSSAPYFTFLTRACMGGGTGIFCCLGGGVNWQEDVLWIGASLSESLV